VYWGGYLAVLIFCGGKMLRTGSWRNYAGTGAGRDAALSFAMGAFHFTSQIAYGAGAYDVGRLGTTVGFAVMISASIILANLFRICCRGMEDGRVKLHPHAVSGFDDAYYCGSYTGIWK
jgi:hypothetical protein